MANASCANCTLVSNVLTLVGAVSGSVLVGMTITGAGVPPGVTVTSLGTGTGQAGTYNCSASTANVTAGEAMVFSLSWVMPLQGNADKPQLLDYGRAAGFGVVIAAVFGGGTAGPGQEYQHGTHQLALYNAQAISGSRIFPSVPGKQGPSVTTMVTTLPQYPEPVAPQLFDLSPFERATGNQPLRLITAAPQQIDLTIQPWITPAFSSESFGWTSEYQFGTHQAALYNSQISSQIFSPLRTPVSAAGVAPIHTVITFPQEATRDLTIQGWSNIPSVPQGWIITMITAGPQLADLTIQAQVTTAQPFHSAAPPGPTAPTTIVAIWQQDPTQQPAKIFAPPLRTPPVQPLAQQFAFPDRQDYTQPQGLIIAPALPGPAKYVQPAFVTSYEQQYDKTNYPQVLAKPLIFSPPPPPTFERVQATQVGYYANETRNIGDVFDIRISDFADQLIDYIAGQIGYPLFGWMVVVAPNTPLTANNPSPLVTPGYNGGQNAIGTLQLTNKPRTVL
jgi:hypothetical protein